MRKKSICLLLSIVCAASLLTGCNTQNATVADASKKTEEAVASKEVSEDTAKDTETEDAKKEPEDNEDAKNKDVDYSTGKPWMCDSLDGLITADTPVNLKDDYYLYVNKDDLVSTKIPEGYTTAGGVYNLSQDFNQTLLDMFNGGIKTDTHEGILASNLYSLYMDWDSRNELGITPYKKEVDMLEAVSDIKEMTTYFKENSPQDYVGLFFNVGVTVDIHESSKYLLEIGCSNTILDDSAEYSNLTDYGKIKKDAYTKLAKKMLKKLGYDEQTVDEKIENAFKLDSMLADTIYTNNEKQMPDIYEKAYNIYSYEEMKELEGELPILEVIENMGYTSFDKVQLDSPKWLEKMKEIYTDDNLKLIRDNLIVRGAITMAPVLDEECYSWDVECNNAIRGSSGELPYETVAAKNVNSNLEWIIAKVYADQYLKKEDKERISDLVDEIIDEYHNIIKETDLVSDETKEKALEKLDALDKQILYPDDWSPYFIDGLDFKGPEDGGELYEALKEIDRCNNIKANDTLHKKVDKHEWLMPPTQINCYYDPSCNVIVILGAFAKGIVYNGEMSDEELYGKLGAVIGHEISHAFDSSGGQYDKDGNMVNWWTDEDKAAFDERNQKLADYFNSFTLWDNEKVNGDIVTGEACADITGFRCMINLSKKKPGFDYDKFFKAYAKLWMCKDKLQRVYLKNTDVHPQSVHRVNAVLQQYPEFLEFYDINEGDRMYLAPCDRVVIW